jgi:integrase
VGSIAVSLLDAGATWRHGKIESVSPVESESEWVAANGQLMTYKRGKKGIYWYRFMWKGELVRESTHQTNGNVARQMESAHRTSLAKGEVGIREKKPSPSLVEFIDHRFEPWAKATFEKSSPKTWLDWYRVGLRAVRGCKPIANCKLNEISGENIADFAAHRQARGLQVSSINSSLRVLRRVLKLAVEWGALDVCPKVKLMTGERHRERVVTPDEEGKYLAAAPEPLASVAAILFDMGLRPEECFRLRWEAIDWVTGHHGTVLVTHGKTAAARRVVPMTVRARKIMKVRWEKSGKPCEGWVWAARTRSGHMESSSLKRQHKQVFKTLAKNSETANQKPVSKFVLYSLRHTFLTRLGQSGCDTWTLAKIAGHSDIRISTRYVHSSGDAVHAAMARLGGHKFGHNQLPANSQGTEEGQLTQ